MSFTTLCDGYNVPNLANILPSWAHCILKYEGLLLILHFPVVYGLALGRWYLVVILTCPPATFFFLLASFALAMTTFVVKKHPNVGSHAWAVQRLSQPSIVWEKQWLLFWPVCFHLSCYALGSWMKTASSVPERLSGRSHRVVTTSHLCAQVSTALHRTVCCLGLRNSENREIYSKLRSF